MKQLDLDLLLVADKAQPLQAAFLNSGMPRRNTPAALLDTESVFNGNDIFSLDIFRMCDKKRLDAFRSHKSCVKCGRKGNAFVVERQGGQDNKLVLNFYSINKGDIVLMTVDHILPDSLGGKRHVSNFQTMCSGCNKRKQNVMSITEIDLVLRDPQLESLLKLQFLIFHRKNTKLLNRYTQLCKTMKFGATMKARKTKKGQK